MAIDFHTHIFPDKLAPRAVAALEQSGGAPAAIPGTMEALIDSMRRCGIDYSVNMPIASRPDQTPSINTFAIAVHQRREETGILSFGALHPLYEDWEGELQRIHDAGLPGIKLHPDFQGLFLDDPQMVRVMQAAAGLGLMILIHCGMDPSFPQLHRSTPERLYRILPALPGATVIAAHMGGYRYHDDVEKYLVGSPVYIDTSFTIGRFDDRQVRRILTNHDPDRILFGTDSPWDGQRKSVEDLMGLCLPEELNEKILWKNASRLLGL